jgi:hypothetical protein
MKQIFFLLALLALAVTAHQFEDPCSEGVDEKGQAVDACRAYLMKQCTDGGRRAAAWRSNSGAATSWGRCHRPADVRPYAARSRR